MGMLLQFVDAPDPAANVRYDFNLDDGGQVLTYPLQASGLDLGVPSFDGQPGGVGGYYTYRDMTFTQRVYGPQSAALAQMSALSRELVRPTNWLRLQWDDDLSPVYFKTYATQPGALGLENANEVTEAWDITVPLVADAFAYGAKQTISTATITQAPSGTNAMRLVLPAIRGDVPTPLRVTITPGSSFGNVGLSSGWLIGCVSGKTTLSDAVADIGTGDGFTAGTGTGGGSSNALYFGGTYRAVTVTAGQGVISRLSGNLPNLPSGRYKVLLRSEFDGTTTPRSYVFRLNTNSAAGNGPFTCPSTVQTIPGNTPGWVRRGWVDLGDISVPGGVSSTKDTPPGWPTPSSSLPGLFDLLIGTADSSAGALRMDALKFIPVDGPTVGQTTLLTSLFPRSYYPAVSASTTSGTWDGDTETYWTTVVSGAASPGLVASSPTLRGAYPVADPAADQNVLLVMAVDLGLTTGSTPADGTTTLGATASVDVSYYPKFLYVGDGS